MKRKEKSSIEKRQAVSTLIQSRVPIFAPVKQLPIRQNRDIEIDTPYGTVIFEKCRLTQIHRNILDCIFTYYHARHFNRDGSVAFLISLRQLQKRLGIKATHHQWIMDKLKELKNSTMVIKSKGKTFGILTGVVRKARYSTVKITDNKLLNLNLNTESFYYGIVFESEYMQIFREDINIHSEKLTESIIKLKDAFLQAFVRFCLTHRQLNMQIYEVFKVIGIKGGERYLRKLRQKLEGRKEEIEKEFGIKVENNCVFYNQHTKIWFESPVKSGETAINQPERPIDTGLGTGLICKAELV